MTKGAISRKQLLKEPDQFITFSGKLIAFGKTNLKAILIGAGAFFTVLVAFVVIQYTSDRNENQASELVEKTMAKYTAALADTDPKTAYDRVKGDFSAIITKYGSKRAAQIARIVFGDISYNAGDADNAIQMYTQALDTVGDFPALKNLVLSGLGYAYALKKEYPQSIRYFEMISDGDDNTMKSGAIFNLAWLYETTGDKEKSTALYTRLMEDFPNTIYSDLLKEKVNG